MEYHRFLRDEVDPELVLMFEYVTFDNRVEDTAGWRLSESSQQPIVLSRRTIVPNELYSLSLAPERPYPISVRNNDMLTQDEPQTLALWVRPTSPGERGILQYGEIGVSVYNVDPVSEMYDLAVTIGNQSRMYQQDLNGSGDFFVMTRREDDFDVYINGDFIETVTESNVPVGNLLVGASSVAGESAHVDVQAISLHKFSMQPNQIENLYSMGTAGHLTLRVESSDRINFADDSLTAIQAEWQIIGV